jgi:uncharacterized protein YdaL
MKTNINQRALSRNKAETEETQTRFSGWVSRKLGLIFLTLALIALLVMGGGEAFGAKPKPAPAPAPSVTPKVLILYDNAGTYGWYGDIDRQLLTNLLGHFAVTVTSKPVERYTAGDIEANDTTFYLGAVWANVLPAAFKSDMLSSTKTVCWLGYNLWQVAWTPDQAAWDPAFTQKFGVDFLGNDYGFWSKVVYKNQVLTRETPTTPEYPYPPEIGRLEPDPYATVSVTAVATCQTADDPPLELPYITHAGNLWYVADNPLTYITPTDRYLAFADVLHDVLNINHAESHRAHVRIEDVAPTADPVELDAIADYLYAQKVPFAVSVIPQYRDPLGHYNGGVPVSLDLNKAVTVANALGYMVVRGGAIVQHGLTHQYAKTPNPFNAVTGDDYEFYRVTKDPTTLGPVYVGPIPGDSATWATNRVNQGKNLLTKLRLTPVAWSTPHYIASATDYGAFAKIFPLHLDRGAYFSTGTDGKTYVANQMLPYVIQKDVYGIKRMPENIGYVELGIAAGNPDGFTPVPPFMPADMLKAAQANLVVRDGWASFYIHPDLEVNGANTSLTYLQTLVEGIKALGYEFVATPTKGVIN